jgi:hypothetical protein
MSSERCAEHDTRSASWQDGAIAIAFTAIGITVIALMMATPTAGVGYHDLKSPTLFPLVIAYIILAAATILAVRTIGRKQRSNPSSNSRPRYVRAGLGVIALLSYGVGIFSVGFWLSSTLSIVAMGLLLDAKSLTRSSALQLVIVAVTAPLLVIWIFRLFLAVEMPTGGGF